MAETERLIAAALRDARPGLYAVSAFDYATQPVPDTGTPLPHRHKPVVTKPRSPEGFARSGKTGGPSVRLYPAGHAARSGPIDDVQALIPSDRAAIRHHVYG